MKIKTSARDFPLSPTPIPVIAPIGVEMAAGGKQAVNRTSTGMGTTARAVDPQRSIINKSKV